MSVLLARVDNRMVHGQVLEAWVPRLGIETILVVDRDLASDGLQRAVLEGLESPGLHILLEGPDRAAKLLAESLRERRVLLLFPGIRQAREAFEAGAAFEELDLGNLHPSRGSRSLTLSVHLTPDDEADLRSLVDRGVRVSARAVPGERGPDVRSWLEGGGRG